VRVGWRNAVPPASHEARAATNSLIPVAKRCNCSRPCENLKELPIGTCKLCRRDDLELRDSHFIPAAILRALREDRLPNPNPVIVTSSLALTSSRPITDHILCEACEGAFSRGGEEWVANNIAQRDTFPLYDVLRPAQPLSEDDELVLYEGRAIDGLRRDQLGYFGLSIFWRSAAHRWPMTLRKSRPPQIELGPFEEAIRSFLVGATEFPQDVALIVTLRPFDTQNLLATLPALARREGDYRLFKFLVPGIDYTLAIGHSLPDIVRQQCIVSSPLGLIAVSKDTSSYLGEHMRKALSTAHIADKLRRFLGAPRPGK